MGDELPVEEGRRVTAKFDGSDEVEPLADTLFASKRRVGGKEAEDASAEVKQPSASTAG